MRKSRDSYRWVLLGSSSYNLKSQPFCPKIFYPTDISAFHHGFSDILFRGDARMVSHSFQPSITLDTLVKSLATNALRTLQTYYYSSLYSVFTDSPKVMLRSNLPFPLTNLNFRSIFLHSIAAYSCLYFYDTGQKQKQSRNFVNHDKELGRQFGRLKYFAFFFFIYFSIFTFKSFFFIFDSTF